MRTILWDLDGTLADTEALHLEAWEHMLHTHGVPIGREEFLATFGRSNRSILSELFRWEPDDPRVDQLSREKEATFRRMLAPYPLACLPGVRSWLEALQQAGVLQVISSSGTMANIAAVAHKLEIADYFVSLMSGATLPRGKPDPAIFLNSAAAVGAASAECIVVEDSIHGIAGARRAGMPSIAVGRLAGSEPLSLLLEATPGPPCLPIGNLEELTWAHLDALWEGRHVQHPVAP